MINVEMKLYIDIKDESFANTMRYYLTLNIL